MILAILCLFMGLSAMVISGYYSFQWFIQRGMPIWIAAVIAIFYVGFTNIIFEYGISYIKEVEVWRQKLVGSSKSSNNYKIIKPKKFMAKLKGIGTLVGWLILSAYSMYCTVGGQYDQLKQIESTGDHYEQMVIDYSNTITMKELSLADYRAEVEQLNIDLQFARTLDGWQRTVRIQETNLRLNTVREEINKLVAELEELYIKQAATDYESSFNISKRGFFVYISELRKSGTWDPVMIQFYSALFPSIIIDILSPICLTIFILTWRKKKKVRVK